MTDTTYNGWANYPTWCVNLWLGNDESLYNEAVEIVQAEIADEHPKSQYWTIEESVRHMVADTLKDWVTDDLCPDLGASFPADLLAYALGEVNWTEIATAWIETATDQVTT